MASNMKLNPLNHMSSLLGKILLALLTSTVLALLLVSIIQRSGFKQGLQEFLQQQEQTQLSNLVPELEQWYRERGSWEALRGSNRQWLRLLARARPEGIMPPEAALLDSAPSPSLDAEPVLSDGPRETKRNRAYDWGWTIVRFIESVYGRDMIVQIVRECADGNVLRMIGGDIGELEVRWKDWLLVKGILASSDFSPCRRG